LCTKEVTKVPLVQITTKPKYHPCASNDQGTVLQRKIGDFGRALPGLFIENAARLHLDEGTPETGIQVSHKKTHGQDVNVPDVWITIQFSERPLTKKQTTKVIRRVKKLIASHLNLENLGANIDIAVDCFWGPTHGFLYIGGVQAEW